MNELSLDKLENLQGGKFWGETCKAGSRIGNTSQCHATCKYQVFWVVVDRYNSIVSC